MMIVLLNAFANPLAAGL